MVGGYAVCSVWVFGWILKTGRNGGQYGEGDLPVVDTVAVLAC